MDPRDIKDVIAEIEAEGNRFVSVPTHRFEAPFYTMGREAMRKQAEDFLDELAEEDDGGCTT